MIPFVKNFDLPNKNKSYCLTKRYHKRKSKFKNSKIKDFSADFSIISIKHKYSSSYCDICKVLIKNDYILCLQCNKKICNHPDCRLILPEIKKIPNDIYMIIESYIGIQCYNCI
jgi:hypothetical protein